MQLENVIEMNQSRVSERRQPTSFVVGDLESLSASALYTGEIALKANGSFAGINGLGVGSSDFQVSLPMSNSIDYSLRISTPESILIVNSCQRIIGQSGVDYFNPNGSIAGRILGLNNAEIKYLKDLDK